MTLGRHQGHVIEDVTVGTGLPWKAVQIVLGTLDLVSAEHAVDNGHVDSEAAVVDAKLVDDHGVGPAAVVAVELTVEDRSDIGVLHTWVTMPDVNMPPPLFP